MAVIRSTMNIGELRVSNYGMTPSEEDGLYRVIVFMAPYPSFELEEVIVDVVPRLQRALPPCAENFRVLDGWHEVKYNGRKYMSPVTVTYDRRGETFKAIKFQFIGLEPLHTLKNPAVELIARENRKTFNRLPYDEQIRLAVGVDQPMIDLTSFVDVGDVMKIVVMMNPFPDDEATFIDFAPINDSFVLPRCYDFKLLRLERCIYDGCDFNRPQAISFRFGNSIRETSKFTFQPILPEPEDWIDMPFTDDEDDETDDEALANDAKEALGFTVVMEPVPSQVPYEVKVVDRLGFYDDIKEHVHNIEGSGWFKRRVNGYDYYCPRVLHFEFFGVPCTTETFDFEDMVPAGCCLNPLEELARRNDTRMASTSHNVAATSSFNTSLTHQLSTDELSYQVNKKIKIEDIYNVD